MSLGEGLTSLLEEDYRELTRGTGLVTGAAEVIWVSGPESVNFLQGLLTQDVEALGSGECRRSFLLSPQGKLVALLWVWRGEERLGLIADAGVGSRVIDDLNRYRIRVKATIEDRPQPVPMLVGPGVAGDQTGVSAPLGGLARRFVFEGAANARSVGEPAWTAVRVEAGEPQMHRDVDENTIPQETGLVRESVSFEKGCYLGQELVARIDTRGHVNRHLRGIILLDGDQPPERSEIFHMDRQVGMITSVCRSPGFDHPIGLSLLRREAAPGSALTIRWPGGEAQAAVAELPLVGAR
jgi:folate-binding protein YgfZ